MLSIIKLLQMTEKWSFIFRAHVALELPLSIVYCLVMGKKSTEVAPAMKPDTFPFPLDPSPPKPPTFLKKERKKSFVCLCW